MWMMWASTMGLYGEPPVNPAAGVMVPRTDKMSILCTREGVWGLLLLLLKNTCSSCEDPSYVTHAKFTSPDTNPCGAPRRGAGGFPAMLPFLLVLMD